MYYTTIKAAFLAFAFAFSANAQSSTATPSTLTTATASSSKSSITSGPSTSVISVFGPATTLGYDGIEGSLVNVQNGLTTFAFSCGASASVECSFIGSITATAGPSDYQITYSVTTDGAIGTLTASCKVTGHTTGTCYETIYVSAPGTTTKTSTSTTITSAEIVSVPITLTAGNLAALTGPGTATTNTATGNAAAPTGAYNYMGAGAAGLAALLLV